MVSERIVFAYSGDVESSAALRRLVDDRGAAVTALVLDIGQRRELEELRLRAIALGASRAHVLDARDDFARDCMLPAIRSRLNPCAARGSALAYPLIARKLVEVASIEQAPAVAHSGSAAAHVAIAGAVQTINPGLTVIAAASEPGRGTALPAPVGMAAPDGGVTVNCSLWCRTVTRSTFEGDAAPLPESLYALTRSVERTPDIPANIAIAFEDGVPVSINGVPMPLVELIESVTTLAGSHGVGRSALSSGAAACEAPAAVVLAEAHATLAGGTPKPAAGIVRMKLFRGEHAVVGHSPVAVADTAAMAGQHS